MTLRELECSSTTLPCIVKVAENHQLNTSTPSPISDKPLLLHSTNIIKKIICVQPSKSEEMPCRFSIPIDYQGYFEVLSENRSYVQPLTKISDVVSLKPEKVLIRSKIQALMDIKDNDSIKTLARGTVIRTRGIVRVTSEEQEICYVHCYDTLNVSCDLYIRYDTTGMFSPIAGSTNIAGVHSIKSLICKFRLPILVRAVSGNVPVQILKGNEPGVLRLLSVKKEQEALILPLCKEQSLLSMSLSKNFVFHKPANCRELENSHIFRQIVESCQLKVAQQREIIRVLKKEHALQDCQKQEEAALLNQIDELYPFVRRGGMPDRVRAKSLCFETLKLQEAQDSYRRTQSHPALTVQKERRNSALKKHQVRQHIVISPKVEKTYEFRSNSDCLSLGQYHILQAFIDEHDDLTSESATSQHSTESAESLYFTLEPNQEKEEQTVTNTIQRIESIEALRC